MYLVNKPWVIINKHRLLTLVDNRPSRCGVYLIEKTPYSNPMRVCGKNRTAF